MTTTKVPFVNNRSDLTNRDGFVGLCQHGNEHIDQHDDHAAAVSSKHEFSHKLCQVMTLIDSEDVDWRQPVHGKVQRLNDLEQAAFDTR